MLLYEELYLKNFRFNNKNHNALKAVKRIFKNATFSFENFGNYEYTSVFNTFLLQEVK